MIVGGPYIFEICKPRFEVENTEMNGNQSFEILYINRKVTGRPPKVAFIVWIPHSAL